MDEFDLYFKESYILFEEAKQDLSKLIVSIDNFVFENSDDSAFDSILDKIKAAITRVKVKIVELINSKQTESKIKKLQSEIKNNPELEKQEVKMIDYEKLDKLTDDTQKKLSNPNCDVEKEMEKYRKQRNKILSAGAIVTVTLGSALLLVTKNKNKKISKLDEMLQKTQNDLESYKNKYNKSKKMYNNKKLENSKLKDEIQILKQKGVVEKSKVKASQINRDIIKSSTTSVAKIKEAGSARIEVVQDASKDILSNIKDAVDSLSDSKKSTIKKAIDVSKSSINNVKVVKDVISGKTFSEVSQKRKEDIKSKAEKILKLRKKAKDILKSESSSKEDKQKASKFLSKSKIELEKLGSVYKNM